MYIKTIFGLIFSIAVLSCNNNQQNEKSEQKFKPMGNIERLDAELDNIISKDAKIEIIADGFEWSEGPLWVEAHQMLLFSDVPMNTIYKLKQQGHSDDPGERGTVVLLTDSITRPNGLAFLPFGQKLIVSCSDPNKPNWYIWDVKGDSLINGKIFYSAAEEAKTMGGLPDGLKIDKNGNVFATGPG